jgi:hypothetical protein
LSPISSFFLASGYSIQQWKVGSRALRGDDVVKREADVIDRDARTRARLRALGTSPSIDGDRKAKQNKWTEAKQHLRPLSFVVCRALQLAANGEERADTRRVAAYLVAR